MQRRGRSVKKLTLCELRGEVALVPRQAAVIQDQLQVWKLPQRRLEQVRTAREPGEDGHVVAFGGGEQVIKSTALEQGEFAGLLAIRGLLRWLNRGGFLAFFLYRAALAALLLFVVLRG